MANYKVEGKKVIAKVALLSEKELAAIKNYIALGYTLEEYKPEKKVPKEAFKAQTIQKWLKENGTEEQQKKYWKLFNDPVLDKVTGEPLKKKDGTNRVKGHVATFAWFKKEFPKYIAENKENE
jgi:hypothetical protein